MARIGNWLRLIAAGLSLVVFGFLGFWALNKEAPQLTEVAEVINFSTDTPDEQKPDTNTFVWKGQASDPKYISLPTIGAEGFIQNVGIDQNNAVAVPNNIHMAGWFTGSARPGQAGLSIIDGHVDGAQGDGIFKNLVNLKLGDELTVRLGDETTKRYRVKEVVSVDTARSAEVLFSHSPTIASQLNLVTCGGNFDKQTGQYEQRVIVVAELIA